jgi:hypothetical protein
VNLQPPNIIVFKKVRPREQDQFFSIPKKKLLSLTYSTKIIQVINLKVIQREKERKEGRICHLKINLLSYL